MNTKINNPFNIETPKTVEEFRNNLKKYYVCEGSDRLMVRDKNGIPFDKIDSLYGLGRSENGFEDVWITPQIDLKKDIYEYMMENDLIYEIGDYFKDEKNYRIYENQSDFLSNGDCRWVKTDNRIYREFFIWSLGEFSGYTYETEVV